MTADAGLADHRAIAPCRIRSARSGPTRPSSTTRPTRRRAWSRRRQCARTLRHPRTRARRARLRPRWASAVQRRRPNRPRHQVRRRAQVARGERTAAVRGWQPRPVDGRRAHSRPWPAVHERARQTLDRDQRRVAVRLDRQFDSEHALTERCRRWLAALRRVPYLRTIEVDTGRIEIVHTVDFTTDWQASRSESVRSGRKCATAPAGRTPETTPRPCTTKRCGRGLPSNTKSARTRVCPDPSPVTAPVLTGDTPDTQPRWTRCNVLSGVHVPECGPLTNAGVQTGTARPQLDSL